LFTQYFICHGSTSSLLQDVVTRAITSGWEPVGGVAVSGEASGSVVFYQAVARTATVPLGSLAASIGDPGAPDITLNATYSGRVTRITDFGAFVEVVPGIEGLLHVSEIADYRVREVRDELTEGQQVRVKVINIDPTGKIRLSRKAVG